MGPLSASKLYIFGRCAIEHAKSSDRKTQTLILWILLHSVCVCVCACV